MTISMLRWDMRPGEGGNGGRLILNERTILSGQSPRVIVGCSFLK